MTSELITGEQITQLLNAWQNGDEHAFAKVFESVYQQLHRIAQNKLKNEYHGSAMRATALLNEAYLILFDKQGVELQSRDHFFNLAGLSMYRFLVDQARERKAVRHGGDIVHTVFDEQDMNHEIDANAILYIDEALEKLEEKDPELIQIIKLRFFAGFTIKETAEVMKLPVVNVNRRWTFAKAWLKKLLNERSPL